MALQQRQQQLEETMKAVSGGVSKTLVIRINLAFLSFFLLAYVLLFLQPESFYSDVVRGGPADALRAARCLGPADCQSMKLVAAGGTQKQISRIVKESPSSAPLPFFLDGWVANLPNPTIGLVSAAGTAHTDSHSRAWGSKHPAAKIIRIEFDRVSPFMEWKHLFPEWIDEEEDNEGPSCPEIPMPDLSGNDIGASINSTEPLDVVVAWVPCRHPEAGWARDPARLQAHLAAVAVAAARGRRDGSGKVKIAVWSPCRLMIEMFRCDDLVGEEGDEWWMFETEAERLREKLALPVGSCNLALPLWKQGSVHDKYDPSEIPVGRSGETPSREAYATVIHSSDKYTCGALALAHSLRATGTDRDLILLHDASIPPGKLASLAAAGWKLQLVKRIRNPNAEKGTYNEYNYTKLRLWLLTQYRKVVFVDSDVVVLQLMDSLFRFPQISAVGNDGSIFNSGVMVLEPSKCTFRGLMSRRREIVSYNGGDQGFLNEAFVWWHRLPRRYNFLKNFWSNDSAETALKNRLFGADPPELYAVHYLGIKPWQCYRDYDCNWDIADQRVYASDVAHRRWWALHDAMPEPLRGYCNLTETRRIELDWDRKKAAESAGRLDDLHWNITVRDPRRQAAMAA